MAKKITLNHITKIEGHAKLSLGIDKGKITTCELSSTEGARYFEGLVKGRKWFEAHEMTSRICGICSCAHVIAAISAMEDALNYTPTEQTYQLRVLLTLGERIRSHATHLYFLALPDYLGYESALAMAPKFREELKSALQLMKAGNHIITLLGGRDLHPVSAAVGGWLHLPTDEEIAEVGKQMKAILPHAVKTCDLFFGLKTPTFTSESDWFSLKDDKEYAVLKGAFTSKNASFDKDRYLEFIREYHQPYSTANFVVRDERRYMVNALARLNNNHAQLRPKAKQLLKRSTLKLPSLNPYENNIAQAIEMVHCIEHAMEICKNLKIQDEKPAQIQPRAGRGVGCIEVPRGTLWHEYELDNEGTITHANIVTPTAQNLLSMQEDIRQFVPTILNKKKDDIVMDVEKLIRSYDPCFSCSAHFLEVNWQ
jgi:coenzyme F420-reducing hydrogenase alpha subunit